MVGAFIGAVIAGLVVVAAVSVFATRRSRALRKEDALPIGGRIRTVDTWMVVVAFGGIIVVVVSVVTKTIFRH